MLIRPSRLSLDNMHRDVQSVTAFRNATELLLACKGGYVPTLIPQRDDPDRVANAKLRIREWLGDQGCTVFPVRA